MQTLQLSSMEPNQTQNNPANRLTFVQELPDGKVFIQEAKQAGDSITSILEEMKQEEMPTAVSSGGHNLEYATAIPVAVTSLASDPKKTTIRYSKFQTWPWKDHLKSDLRADQDHLLRKDLRSDQNHIF
jgi:hypothetical protein